VEDDSGVQEDWCISAAFSYDSIQKPEYITSLRDVNGKIELNWIFRKYPV
jgi:hypothetical protein